jgi:hypothetical protein
MFPITTPRRSSSNRQSFILSPLATGLRIAGKPAFSYWQDPTPGEGVIVEPIAHDWAWFDAIAGKLDEDFVQAVNEKAKVSGRNIRGAATFFVSRLAQSADHLRIAFGFTAGGVESVTASRNNDFAVAWLPVDDSTLADGPIAYDPELRKCRG